MERTIKELQQKDIDWIKGRAAHGIRICEGYGAKNPSQPSFNDWIMYFLCGGVIKEAVKFLKTISQIV